MGKLAINGGSPVRSSYLPYGHQSISEADISSVVSALKSDYITQGPLIEKFEKLFADYIGRKYAVAVSSGTAALHAATFASGLKKGEIGITSPISFVASSNCIIYQNGRPSFVDINSEIQMDSFALENTIDKKTKLIIPVNFAGQCCDIDSIISIASSNNSIVIEDCCHALGSEFKGIKAGKKSDMAIFSFHPVKHMTTGEGGMVVTDNIDYYKKLLSFRTHGIIRDEQLYDDISGAWYYEMQTLGFNYRMTDFQAALGISQLKRLDEFIERRREIATLYNSQLSNIDEIDLIPSHSDSKSAFHIFPIMLNMKNLRVNRKIIYDSLIAENIGVNVHYIPIHLQPYYRSTFGYKAGDYPLAEDYYSRCLTIPIFPSMSDKDVYSVIEAIKKVTEFYKS